MHLEWQQYTTLRRTQERVAQSFSTCLQFSSVQFNRSVVSNSVTPWAAARQAFLSITNSWSLLKLTESVMPSSHIIVCHPLLLLPSVFPSIRVFSNESVHRIRWPEYWSFSFSINPSNEYSGSSIMPQFFHRTLVDKSWYLLGWTMIQSHFLDKMYNALLSVFRLDHQGMSMGCELDLNQLG